MGFSNGYDSGYSDAIDDVKAGRVQGLGPVAEGGSEGGSEEGSGGSIRPGHGPGTSLGSGSSGPKVVTLAGDITSTLDQEMQDAGFAVYLSPVQSVEGHQMPVIDVTAGLSFNSEGPGMNLDMSQVTENCSAGDIAITIPGQSMYLFINNEPVSEGNGRAAVLQKQADGSWLVASDGS